MSCSNTNDALEQLAEAYGYPLAIPNLGDDLAALYSCVCLMVAIADQLFPRTPRAPRQEAPELLWASHVTPEDFKDLLANAKELALPCQVSLCAQRKDRPFTHRGRAYPNAVDASIQFAQLLALVRAAEEESELTLETWSGGSERWTGLSSELESNFSPSFAADVLTGIREEVCWVAAAATNTGQDSGRDPTAKTKKKKSVGKANQRMFEFMANPNNKDWLEWSARRWASLLGCASSTITDTEAWKTIMKMREASRNEQIDRRKSKTAHRPAGATEDDE